MQIFFSNGFFYHHRIISMDHHITIMDHRHRARTIIIMIIIMYALLSKLFHPYLVCLSIHMASPLTYKLRSDVLRFDICPCIVPVVLEKRISNYLNITTTKKPQHAGKPHFPQAVRDDGLRRGWAKSLSQVGEFFCRKG